MQLLRQRHTIRLKWIICVLTLFVLSACGGVGEPQIEYPPLTFPPPPPPAIAGSCDETSEFAEWLQTAEFRYREFDEFLSTAVGRDRETMYSEVQRLGEVVVIVSQAPAPDCAEDAKILMIDAMQTTAEGLQEYINRDRDDMQVIVNEAREKLAVALVAHEQLTEQLEAQYRGNS